MLNNPVNITVCIIEYHKKRSAALEDCVSGMVESSVPGFHLDMLSQLYISLFNDS